MRAFTVAGVVVLILGALSIATAPAHVAGHVYSTDDATGAERLPTSAQLCGTNAGKVARYYNVGGAGANDNDLWARRTVTGNSWLIRVYASKANTDTTDLIWVKSYIRSLSC